MRFLILALLLMSCGAQAQHLMDIRYVPITREELAQRIDSTPIDSPKHAIILTRAHGSGLYREAYEDYKRIWERNQNNAMANLWFGTAAGSLYNYVHFKENHNKYPDLDSAQIGKMGGECVAKSVKLAPNSAWTNMWYGCGKWFWGPNDSDSGEFIGYVEKAVRLEPNNPTAHLLLATVHSNPYVKHFNAVLAEKEFKTAIRLDPTYAQAHTDLARFYFDIKRYKDAKKEHEIGKSLVPPSLAEAQPMLVMDHLIEEGLKREKGK